LRRKAILVTKEEVIIQVEQYDISFVKIDGKVVKKSHIDWGGCGTRPPDPFYSAAIVMAAAIFKRLEDDHD
jgi:hypothetical protein